MFQKINVFLRLLFLTSCISNFLFVWTGCKIRYLVAQVFFLEVLVCYFIWIISTQFCLGARKLKRGFSWFACFLIKFRSSQIPQILQLVALICRKQPELRWWMLWCRESVICFVYCIYAHFVFILRIDKVLCIF